MTKQIPRALFKVSSVLHLFWAPFFSTSTSMIYFTSSKKQLYITMLMIILTFFSKTLSHFIGVLEEEAGVILNWLKGNQMIANPEKFHAVLIKKDQTNLSLENLKGEQVKSEETVKLLGFTKIIS